MIDAAAGGNDARRRVVRPGPGYGDVVRVMIGVILIDELNPLIGFHVIQRNSRRRAGLRPESIAQLLQRLASLGRVRACSELSVDSVGGGVGGPVTGIESTRVTPHQLFNFRAEVSWAKTVVVTNVNAQTTAITKPIRTVFMCCSFREGDQNLSIRGQCVSIRVLTSLNASSRR